MPDRRRGSWPGLPGCDCPVYIPSHFSADNAAVTEVLANITVADLVTATGQGPVATLLPFVYASEIGEHGALFGHVARNNDQWSRPAVGEALVIVHGPDAYITPNWYATKVEHGRVVPTWNYVIAHVYGRLVVHDDPGWVGTLVRRLTDRHEAGSKHPWSMDDAPEHYIAGQMRAIVGVELLISRVEAKFKLSQNRPEADVRGVIAGLDARGKATQHLVAALVQRVGQGDGRLVRHPKQQRRVRRDQRGSHAGSAHGARVIADHPATSRSPARRPRRPTALRPVGRRLSRPC